MRVLLGPAFLALGACAATDPTAGTDGPLQSCEVAECFMQRDVRDFEVLDDNTLVVYTGAQRCAFLVETRGFDCSLSFAPEIAFVQPQLGSATRAVDDPFGADDRYYRAPERVCGYTRSLVVHAGPFDRITRSPLPSVDPFREACDVTEIKSLTDDELLELYVDRNLVAPPPPAGTGEIQVVEPEREAEPAGEDDAADTAGGDGASGPGGASAGGGEGSAGRGGEAAAGGGEVDAATTGRADAL